MRPGSERLLDPVARVGTTPYAFAGCPILLLKLIATLIAWLTFDEP